MLNNKYFKTTAFVISSIIILGGCAIYSDNYSCEQFKEKGIACQRTTDSLKQDLEGKDSEDPKIMQTEGEIIKDLKAIKEKLENAENSDKETIKKIEKIEKIIAKYEEEQKKYMIKKADDASTMKIYIDKNTMQPFISQPRVLKITLLPYTDPKTNKYVSLRSQYIIVKQAEFIEVDPSQVDKSKLLLKQQQDNVSVSNEKEEQSNMKQIEKIIAEKFSKISLQKDNVSITIDNSTIKSDNSTVKSDISAAVIEEKKIENTIDNFVKVRSSRLNARKEPNTKSKIVATFNKGSLLKKCDDDTNNKNGWVAIFINKEQCAYVSEKFVEPIKSLK